MILKSFCGCLSLQVGVVILSFAFIQIAFVILTVNAHYLFDYRTSMIIVIVFAVLMMITGLVMITAAYKEQRKMCLIALLMIAVLVLLFLGGSAASFYNRKPVTHCVCIESRCPESLWISTLNYRIISLQNYTEESNATTTTKTTVLSTPKDRPPGPEVPDTTLSSPSTEGKKRRRRKDTPEIWTGAPEQPIVHTTPPPVYEYYEYNDEEIDLYNDDDAEFTGYKPGATLVIAVTLFFVNLIFFIFSALIVLSFSLELKTIRKLSR